MVNKHMIMHLLSLVTRDYVPTRMVKMERTEIQSVGEDTEQWKDTASVN